MKFIVRLKIIVSNSGTHHIQTVVANTRKEKLHMKIEIRAPRTNSTFGFLPTHGKANIKNQKSYFLPTLDKEIVYSK